MKLRTVRRRRDVDQSVTQSLTEVAMRVGDFNDSNGNTEYTSLDANSNTSTDCNTIVRNAAIGNTDNTDTILRNNNKANNKVTKRVSFSQVDTKDSESPDTKRVVTKGKAVLRLSLIHI